jgi:AraC family transcriptional regulator, regulatory protein of adaptative response / methylated-DNA-[protein]-cysteine methyltransferase
MNSRMHTASVAAADAPAAAFIPDMDAETAWKQVLARDRAATFFYGVVTTGVFCRPWCMSRRPLRVNARFFPTAEAAEAAGFRACRVCRPADVRRDPLDRVREHIEAHLDRPVRLAELGRVAGLSPFTVQRVFKREMGVSPLGYQRALRAARLRSALKDGADVTDAIYEAGFGSSSRGYEGAALGMTPARFAQGGRGERISYATARSPFGWIVVGATERGLCWLALAATESEAKSSIFSEFPRAEMRREPALEGWVEAAVAGVRGEAAAGVELDLRGTAFQLRVWEALRRIPRGETRTYSELAREMGIPSSTRAVARACAVNRVSIFVPCHRVVGASGSLTGYRWGVERKRQILAAEATAGERAGGEQR